MINIIIGLAILVVFIIAGFPFWLSLLASGIYLLTFVGNIPAMMAVTGFYEGVAKVSLLAVPFFFWAGSLMQQTSISERLVKVMLHWVKHFRGGIPLTGLAVNEVFGAMSGSAPAAVGTIGRVMHPMVTKSNSEKFSLGLFASAGALAIIMPPSVNMIIFGAVTNTSIGALFIAGVIPAIVIGVIMAVYIVAASKKDPADTEKFGLSRALKGTLEGLPVLSLPVILLGGIYTGIFTPTEAGIISVAYILILAWFFKELNWKVFKTSLAEAVHFTAQIFILIGASTVFSQALTITGIPAMLSQVMGGLHPVAYLLLLNVVLLIAGCFFEPGSAIIVLAPVLVPIGMQLGINPWHLGMIFTVNLAVGMFTPPFGFNLFICQSVFKKPMELIIQGVLPFIGLYIVALILITYIPSISTWLPRLAGF